VRISQALDIKHGDIVAFTGAGGKTTAMFTLANELVADGWRIVTTTTTRVALDELSQVPYLFSLGPMTRLPKDFHKSVEKFRHVFAFANLDPQNKIRGIRSAWLDENLTGLPYVDALLIEADGSRRLPLKAPLPHEPVIPSSSNLVVPVVGLNALNQPLDEEHVYSADLIADVMGIPRGSPVTGQLIASVVVNPQFGLKGVPQGARVTPLINQVVDGNLESARQIAHQILSDLTIDRVLIGAVKNTPPIRENRRRIGAVILAAGQSKRMGGPKVLLPWGSTTIIRHIAEAAEKLGLHEIVIVAGEWLDEIRKQVSGLRVTVVHNPDYAQGEMLSSLRVGLESLWLTCSACMVVLGDQPWLNRSIVEKLIDAYNTGMGKIVAPSFAGRRGHPLIIDRVFWKQIIDLPPGSAPRDILRANQQDIFHVIVDSEMILKDIDTPSEYQHAQNEWGKH
jgi:molybdenum cofactor cytidylyltransferase